jgi:2-hydroxy-6-oxonona-2,4-dienedioate hydrolase
LPLPAGVYQALFSSNLPYWLLQRITPSSLDPILDISPARRAELTAQEQTMVADMIAGFQPVTGRSKGLGNEGAAIDPGVRYGLEEILTPTLVVHSKDDQINPFPIGESTARHLRNAQLVPLENGGHLLLGHHAEVQLQTTAFLRQHAAPGS